MEHWVNCQWNKEMSFTSKVNGHKIIVDADSEFGGKDRGPRPKPLMLTALAGCTGMDVISILGKMKINPTFFNVDVKAKLSDNQPKTYTDIQLIYEFKASDNLDQAKVKRACELSQENYCGVAAMLRQACNLTWEIKNI